MKRLLILFALFSSSLHAISQEIVLVKKNSSKKKTLQLSRITGIQTSLYYFNGKIGATDSSLQVSQHLKKGANYYFLDKLNDSLVSVNFGDVRNIYYCRLKLENCSDSLHLKRIDNNFMAASVGVIVASIFLVTPFPALALGVGLGGFLLVPTVKSLFFNDKKIRIGHKWAILPIIK